MDHQNTQTEHFAEPLSFEEIKEKSDKYLLGNYKRQPVAFYFGQGEYLYDTNNKQYIDFLSGISVVNLGHGEADIIEAIREQSDRIIHSSNLYYNQEQALLAEVLIEHMFPGKVFFCNSGTEANEAAIKLLRRHGQEKGASRILTLNNSFHGRTTGAMAATGQEKIKSGFGPLMPGFDTIDANDLSALEEYFDQYGDDICGIIAEPVQGEGGIVPLDQEYVNLLRKVTKETNSLLVFDEIQTGIGRTGKLFAYEHFSVHPDAVTLAKALGSGIPVGALIIAEEYTDLLQAGMHGSTFGGNHLASRVAYETIKIIMSREILNHVNALSEYFFRRLGLLKTASSRIQDIRGLGLHIGVVLNNDGNDIVEKARQAGLIINCTAGNVIRIMPPLTTSLEVAAEGLSILERLLSDSGTQLKPELIQNSYEN